MNNILLTSGYNFEGYSISEYLGVYSGECALGTGFLSTLGASLADFLGSNSTMYSDKLKTAKPYAMEQLMTRVENAGGNPLLALISTTRLFPQTSWELLPTVQLLR